MTETIAEQARAVQERSDELAGSEIRKANADALTNALGSAQTYEADIAHALGLITKLSNAFDSPRSFENVPEGREALERIEQANEIRADADWSTVVLTDDFDLEGLVSSLRTAAEAYRRVAVELWQYASVNVLANANKRLLDALAHLGQEFAAPAEDAMEAFVDLGSALAEVGNRLPDLSEAERILAASEAFQERMTVVLELVTPASLRSELEQSGSEEGIRLDRVSDQLWSFIEEHKLKHAFVLKISQS
jgi:hypothetical protein